MKKLISIVASLALAIVPLATITTTITTPTETIAAGDEKGLISAGNAEGLSYGWGVEYVSVPVYLEKNPGIIATSITVEYDSDYLELESVDDNQLFSGATFTPSGKMSVNPFRLTWENALATENYTDTGVLAYLNFRIKSNNYWDRTCELGVSVEAENTFDKDINEVPFDTENGSIHIYAVTTSMPPETTTTTEETTTVTSTTEATTTTETTTNYPETTTTTEETTTVTSTTEATTTTETTTNYPETSTTEETTTVTSTTEATTTTETTTNYPETSTTEETTTVTSTTEATTTTETTTNYPETTSTVTTTITEPEETTTTTSYVFCYSVAELRDMAKKDYKSKTGIYPDYATSSVQNNGTVVVDLYDEYNNYLTTYTIDPTTGFGITSDGNGVSLPETGMDTATKNIIIGGAVIMILGGSYILLTTRKKEEE